MNPPFQLYPYPQPFLIPFHYKGLRSRLILLFLDGLNYGITFSVGITVDHGKLFASGKVYSNGLEGFWSYAKEK